MFVAWKRNVLFETAVLFAERWRHLMYSNESNFINNALLGLLAFSALHALKHHLTD